MRDLIEALVLLLKYAPNMENPTCCSHDELRVMIDPELVSEDDCNRLEALGFEANFVDECFVSFRFGNC